jgi:hypothetical protein
MSLKGAVGKEPVTVSVPVSMIVTVVVAIPVSV